MNTTAYRGYTADELGRQYDVETAVSNRSQLMAGYQARSDAARTRGDAKLDIAYGPHELQRLDVFSPPDAVTAPIQIYIHGGYWRSSSKNGRAFPSQAFNAVGAVWIPIDYRLLPEVSLDAIVHDVRLAAAWVYENAASFGGDATRIHVSGTSAGGHLTAMLLLDGWQGGYGLPVDVIKGGCAISGLFDLEPLRHIRENRTLRLDDGSIVRNNPMNHIPVTQRSLIVAWGEKESDEFKRQSREFAAAWRKRNSPVEGIELAGHDHFSAIAETADPNGALLSAIFAQMGLSSRA